MGFLLLVLGLIAELLGKLENTFFQMPFAFKQVAMDCFNGQRVMDACFVFEKAVYDCQWEKFNKANRKMVLMLLQNAQQTMILLAGGIATLKFTCLMSIIAITMLDGNIFCLHCSLIYVLIFIHL